MRYVPLSRCAPVALVALTGAIGSASGQTHWNLLTPATSPFGRDHQALAEDPARSRVVLFGGFNSGNGSALRDTWEWDGSNWLDRTPQPPAVYPSGRSQHALAFDAVRTQTLLFGGLGGFPTYPSLDDTWLWDGTSWTSLAPVTRPAGRYAHALTYDATRRRVVLFGGLSGNANPTYLGDTWEWDGTNWLRQFPAVSPQPRAYARLAFDSVRGYSVLFGGITGSADLADTWEWDGTNWLQRAPATTPHARHGHGLSHDAARARIVLFGGDAGGAGRLADTWEWDGTNWALRAPGPSPAPRNSPSLAYDSARRNTVMFGGSNGGATYYPDTWTYAPITQATYSTFGAGCASASVIPALDREPAIGNWPWAGGTFALRLSNLTLGRPGLVILGLSNTTWGTIPLPLDLTGAGLPGCLLRVSLDVLTPVFSGTTTLTVPVLAGGIPGTPDVVGVSFYNQALFLGPLADLNGAALSNGGHGVIGGR